MVNNITNESRVKLEWRDIPENYSRETKNSVQNKLAKKLGISRNNIIVDYIPIKRSANGDVTPYIPQAEDIGNPEYQKNLFTQWYNLENRKCSLDELLSLDYEVSKDIVKPETESNRRRWSMNWLYIDNFMSFGEGNYFPISDLKGIISVTSDPPNTGGKTTLTTEALQFLLYGSTTKADKNEEVFNRYSSKDTVTVRGEMTIEGEEDFIIERKLTRKKKTDGSYVVNGKVNYYKILPNGDETSMNDEDATKTTKLIEQTIGSYNDFNLVTIANSKTLDSIITSTPTENGKVFNRFTGLEILETKEELSRAKYNAWAKTMKSNLYNIFGLKEANDRLTEDMAILNDRSVKISGELADEEESLNQLEAERTILLSSKKDVDKDLISTNIETIESNIKTITDEGVTLKSVIETLKKRIESISDVIYDEYEEKKISDRVTQIKMSSAVINSEISNLKSNIESLKRGEICQSCNRPLDNIDNSGHIKEKEAKITDKTIELGKLNAELDELSIKLGEFKIHKDKLNDRQKLEVELGVKNNKIQELRLALSDFNGLKKKYQDNLDNIQHNKESDIKISKIITDISVSKLKLERLKQTLNTITNEVKNSVDKISSNNKLISEIETEHKTEAIYKTYIEMVGKKGVSKIVLRSLLPLINMELVRITDQTCDFEIEVRISDKNELKLVYIKDGIEGPLKSGSGFESTVAGIALRSVLGHISTLPRPNFVCFDEALDKVSKQYLPNMKLIFERIAKLYYDKVFIISHEEMARDWADKMVMVVKDNNFSKII